MPLPLLNLDDRTYQDLVEEARALIPTFDRNWTNHNASDPGITLIELFAWLSEMLIYRADQVPDQNVVKFLKLLNGPQWAPGPHLADDVAATVVGLRQRWRTVTGDDFEYLARQASAEVARARCVPRQNLAAGSPVERRTNRPGHVSLVVVPYGPLVWLYDGTRLTDFSVPAGMTGGPWALDLQPGRSLYVGGLAPFTAIRFPLAQAGVGYVLQATYFDGSGWAPLAVSDTSQNWGRPGEIRFAVPAGWAQSAVNGVPRFWVRLDTGSAPAQVAQSAAIGLDLPGQVAEFLEPRRILTSRLHVVDPSYVPVRIEVLAAAWSDTPVATVRTAIADRLAAFLDPLAGGQDGEGWPFGRNLYVAELYQVLEAVPGVDHIPDIILSSACPPGATDCLAGSPIYHDDGELIGLNIPGNAPNAEGTGGVSYHLPQVQIRPDRDIVIGQSFVSFRIAVRLTPVDPDPLHLGTILGTVKVAIRRFLRSYHGDRDAPEPLRAALLNLIRGLPEVAYVSAVELTCSPARAVFDGNGAVAGVVIESWELADAAISIEPGTAT